MGVILRIIIGDIHQFNDHKLHLLPITLITKKKAKIKLLLLSMYFDYILTFFLYKFYEIQTQENNNYSSMLRNRWISAGLEPVLNHTEKSCIVLYYRQFSMNNKIKKNLIFILLSAKAIYNTMRKITKKLKVLFYFKPLQY